MGPAKHADAILFIGAFLDGVYCMTRVATCVTTCTS